MFYKKITQAVFLNRNVHTGPLFKNMKVLEVNISTKHFRNPWWLVHTIFWISLIYHMDKLRSYSSLFPSYQNLWQIFIEYECHYIWNYLQNQHQETLFYHLGTKKLELNIIIKNDLSMSYVYELTNFSHV